MADDRRKSAPTGAVKVPEPISRSTPAPIAVPAGAARTGPAPGTPLRDPRTPVVVPVRYRYASILDFVDTQSANISRTGMFAETTEVVPVGTVLDFEVSLDDGFTLLKGKAEVVRVSQSPRGLGMKFTQLDPQSQKLVARIVEVNAQEGKKPTVPMDFVPMDARSGAGGFSSSPSSHGAGGGVTWKEQDVSIQLNPATVSYFVYNPLLNIRLGGFVVPAEKEVPLGTVFTVSITTLQGESLFSGKGKVVAKHEKRLGIRLTDVEKGVLARLQAEVNRLVPSNK